MLSWNLVESGKQQGSVNPLSTKFRQNTLITKFNEFARFTSVANTDGAFYYCTKLAEIELPTSVTNLGTSTGAFIRTAITEIDLKNVTWAWCSFQECPNLTVVKDKNITRYHDTFNKCTKLQRLIVPKAAFSNAWGSMGSNLCYGVHDIELIDLGANVKYLHGYLRYKSNNIYSGTFKNTTVVFRSKSFTFSSKAVLNGCWRCYCTEEMYDYLKNSTYNSYASMVYLIGGAEWTAQFGSSDPYANLTQEEYDYYYKDIVEQG